MCFVQNNLRNKANTALEKKYWLKPNENGILCRNDNPTEGREYNRTFHKWRHSIPDNFRLWHPSSRLKYLFSSPLGRGAIYERPRHIFFNRTNDSGRAELLVFDKSLDKRDTDSNSLLVIDVVVSKEVDKGELFDVDSAGEKLPRDDRVDDEANGIAQNNLIKIIHRNLDKNGNFWLKQKVKLIKP